MRNINRIKLNINKEEFKKKLDIKDGKDYVLTNKDKKDIAKSINVPIVKQIIKEQPIITEVAVSDTAEEIKNKLENLKDENRLDSSAIKGLEKFAEKRAIDILDKRTQFLINKPTTTSSGTDEKVKLNASDATAGYLDDKIIEGGYFNNYATLIDLSTGLSGKQDSLVSGTNIKSINGNSLLGSGDLSISSSPGGSNTQIQFNNSGSFDGSSNFTWDNATNLFTVTGTSYITKNASSYIKAEIQTLNPVLNFNYNGTNKTLGYTPSGGFVFSDKTTISGDGSVTGNLSVSGSTKSGGLNIGNISGGTIAVNGQILMRRFTQPLFTTFVDDQFEVQVPLFAVGTLSTGDYTIFATPSSQTTLDGTQTFRINRTTQNVAIGTHTTASAKLHVVKTTEQLRLGYDTTNYLSTTVNTTGSTTFALTGTSPIFNFSQAVRGNGGFQSSDGSSGGTNTTGGLTFKNGLYISGSISGGGSTWGSITGTLSSQTDLQTALDAKVSANTTITGATKTKISYDSKGLVISGEDATTTDIVDSLNKRYVTDAQLTVLGNTSGTNTGDETTATIKTKLGAATASTDGYATSTQITKLDGIQAGAEVNVNADWNAVSGDAQILNKPTIPTQYTDEMAQDAIGGILLDSSEIDFTYDDITPTITASIKTNSIDTTKLSSGINTSLGKADTALQSSAIGVSIQGYNANTTTLGNSTTGTGNIVRDTSPTLVTPNLGTPTALTLTNATGLPVAGITSSTTQALGLGSIELGHASDTTISRSSAGIIAVEGLEMKPVKTNASTSSQTSTFATDTYLAGSFITFPFAPRVGTTYKLWFDVTKTAAGTATPIITVRMGTAGTTADTSRVAFTFGAGTAVADTGIFEVIVTFRSVGSGTSAVAQGIAQLTSNLTTTGLSNAVKARATTSSGFDSTTANLGIGVSYNGGTSASHTVNLVRAELIY